MHRSFDEVDAQVAKLQLFLLFFGSGECGTSKPCSNPCMQFPEFKRFAEVVVSSIVEGLHACVQIIVGREHQHRCGVATAAQAPADLQAVEIGQGPIQNHKIKALLSQQC